MVRAQPRPSAEEEAARRRRRAAEIDARSSLSPPEPAPDRFRVATWNVNSLRVRLGAVERFVDRARPDVVCLQETRVGGLSAEMEASFAERGFEAAAVGRGG